MAFPIDNQALPQIPDGVFTETEVSGLDHREIHNILHANLPAGLAKLGTGSSLPTQGYALYGVSGGGSLWIPAPRRNLLINGAFRVGASPIVTNTTGINNAYQCANRYRTLFSAAAPIVRTDRLSISPPPFSPEIMDILISGGGGKMGRFQVLESFDTAPLRGMGVSFGINLIAPANVSDVRVAILGWTGTADATQASPIAAWNAAGTNPTLAAGWSYLNAPANVNLPASAWTRIRVQNVGVPGGTTNLAVFWWSDDTTHTASSDFLVANDAALEIGPVCTDPDRVPIEIDIARCNRYARLLGNTRQGWATTSSKVAFAWELNPPMRVTPSVSLVASAIGWTQTDVGTGTSSASAFTFNQSSPGAIAGTINGFGGALTNGYPVIFGNGDFVYANAEL